MRKRVLILSTISFSNSLPSGVGTWPAIWMLGKNINEDEGFFDAIYGTTNWPACGEVDIWNIGEPIRIMFKVPCKPLLVMVEQKI
jgi:hypothetical protein